MDFDPWPWDGQPNAQPRTLRWLELALDIRTQGSSPKRVASGKTCKMHIQSVLSKGHTHLIILENSDGRGIMRSLATEGHLETSASQCAKANEYMTTIQGWGSLMVSQNMALLNHQFPLTIMATWVTEHRRVGTGEIEILRSVCPIQDRNQKHHGAMSNSDKGVPNRVHPKPSWQYCPVISLHCLIQETF